MDLQKTALGIEFGSTRIKAVLIDDHHFPVASGAYEWENQLVDGVWTYSMEAVRTGLQTCFLRLREDVRAAYEAQGFCEVRSLALGEWTSGLFRPF